jgi:hypothetical protein
MGGELRWITVPGEILGLGEARSTPLPVSRALPRFGEAILWIKSRIDNPLFAAWTQRADILPVSLQEVPGAGLPDISHLLG